KRDCSSDVCPSDLLFLPLLVFLIFVFLVPLAAMLWRSFTDPEFGFGNYVAMFAESLYLKVLINTFVIALTVTGVTLLLAYPYAYLMTLAKPFWRGVMLILVRSEG